MASSLAVFAPLHASDIPAPAATRGGPSTIAGVHPQNGSNNTTRGWSQVAQGSSGPSIRDMSMMAYDPAIGKVVLFGGYDPTVVPLGDTWEYGNGSWTQVSTGSSPTPAPRWHAGLAWDAADGTLVLFGGRNLTQFFNDTWTFNGTGWTQVSTASAPSPRGLFGIAYDAADGYVLLYGGGRGNAPAGSGSPWQAFSDTWSYHAGVWTNLTGAVIGTPPAQLDFGMAYDPQSSSVVAFGGSGPLTGSCAPSRDLWSYAAGTWTNLTGLANGPPGEVASSLAYYPADRAVMVFGGAAGCAWNSTAFTYELQNRTWVNLTPTLVSSPTARYEASMAYDAADAEMVLFGGALQGSWYDYYSDTWVYPAVNGSSSTGTGTHNGSGCGSYGWCHLTTPVAPADRDMSSMAFDPALGAIVLFGGYSQFVYPFGDTWTYSNGTWTDISPLMLNSPPARWGESLVWDAADHYLLMFGGRNLTQFFNDTWAFNGSSWTPISTTSAPSPRSLFAFGYDAQAGAVLLFGGWRGNIPAGSYSPGIVLGDTWSYRGGVWTNLTGISTPPPLMEGASAYDNQTNGFEFAGGSGGGSTCPSPGSLWNYSNGSWTSQSGSAGAAPSGTLGPSMTYYPGFQGELYFGGAAGSGCASTNGTYQLAQGTWTNVTPNLTASPTPRYLSAMAYDPIDGQVVLFGGSLQGSYSAYYNDTWVFPGIRNQSGGLGGPSGLGGSGNPGGQGVAHAPLAHASQTSQLGVVPLSVLFSGVATVSAGRASYLWSFGDGSPTQAGALVAHTFYRIGSFTPSLRVTDALGHSTVVTLSTVRVLAVPDSGGRTPGPTQGLGAEVAGSPIGLITGAAVGAFVVALVVLVIGQDRRRRRESAEQLLDELAQSEPKMDP